MDTEAGGTDARVSETTTSDSLTGTLRVVGLVLVCLSSLAQFARAFVIVDGRGTWGWYLVLGAVYLGVFTLITLRPFKRPWLLHAIWVGECLLVLALLSIDPELDFLSALFAPIAFQVALLLPGRTTWSWLTALVVLTAGSLMIYLGPLRGLSLALVPMAVQVVLVASVVVAREIESARRQSQVMLQELQHRQHRLQDYAEQAAVLATVDERDRVADELNDSVASTVTAILSATRAARADLAHVESVGSGNEGATSPTDAALSTETAQRLVALQAQTQQALAQMRGLIAGLRPAGE
jgi:signal transduction histidine kinase